MSRLIARRLAGSTREQSMDLRGHLQASLGNVYTLEHELGGGGMARVFVAEERALGRKVVVKLVSPELASGLSAERFRREIQLAARLQHPHIVPVLSTGELDGIPFYTMPFVDGESLRARLERGALPVPEAVAILRDVAKALAYAHGHGVVHRDIKPDNVLITGGSAVVTDFGIARALSAARIDGEGNLRLTPPGGTLTLVGTTLGTPAYMAPEQAAADPAMDHRADLYAFGCMAYELLAGRTPFAGLSPQRLLAAQMTERPRPVEELRPDTPPALAELVMRCLEKDAAARPQSALALLRELDTVTTSGTGYPALPIALLGRRMSLARALGIWAAVTVTVGAIARAATLWIGLPDWVFPGALAVMAVGLPAILFTAFVQRAARRALVRTATRTAGGTLQTPPSALTTIAARASPHISWRRTWLAGGVALASFAIVVGTFMALRALGIGPEGSLLAAGALERREPLLIDDFRAVGDTSLGSVVAEAVRADLAQSPAISLVPPGVVAAALDRMQRPRDSRLDLPLAREVAVREGIKAVVDGEVRQLGGNYLLTLRLVRADSGQELASLRATAGDAERLIPTIGTLTRRLRGRIGESLRTVNASPPLEQVTTRSLVALQKYAEANAVLAQRGDLPRFVRLMEEAIALDTGFAMAYRRLGVELSNSGGQRARVEQLLRKAFDHRARLPDYERDMAEGSYYDQGPLRERDTRKALAAYEAAIEANPYGTAGLNNAALINWKLGNTFRAESLLRRGVDADPRPAVVLFTNLAEVQLARGERSAAESTLQRLTRAYPASPIVPKARAERAYVMGHLDSATGILRQAYEREIGNVVLRGDVAFQLADLARLQGRIREWRRWSADAWAGATEGGMADVPLMAALENAWVEGWLLDHPARAVRMADSAFAVSSRIPMAGEDEPFARAVAIYAMGARPDRARAVLADFEREMSGSRDTLMASKRHVARGVVAIAERRYADAVRELEAGRMDLCNGCSIAIPLAIAYERMGNTDSALAAYTRYVDSPVRHIGADADNLARAYERLGELWEAKGDARAAARYDEQFIELWKGADPELQPRVRVVRQRLERLRQTAAR